MSRYLVLFLLISVVSVNCSSISSRNENRRFPDGLRFGASTSAYQIEGAWNEDGKSESIWDVLSHKVPNPVLDGTTGDVACDSYHQYRRDVEMLRELGVDHYRFSLAWTRILPTSFPNEINAAGVAYYNNLINELLLYNIEPVVTLYHWDLPQKLQDMGGWANPHVVDWFGDYARVAFELFGDRVKQWNTINEPGIICVSGHGSGTIAPEIQISGIADYLCSKNTLLAHARAYHIYDQEYRGTQGGNIFINIGASWFEPEDENDTSLLEEVMAFELGLYAHPILSDTGDYSPIIKERVAAKSAEQNYPRSRLPVLTAEEIDYVKGTSDYLGVNHYSSAIVYKNESVVGHFPSPSYEDDRELLSYQLEEWVSAVPDASTIIRPVPWMFTKLLGHIRETFKNPPMFITENGFAALGGLDDKDRVDYYRQYLDALLDAIEEGSDIRAYTAWSLMDTFEWTRGFTVGYGLYEVDFTSPERTRRPRRSAYVYKEIIRTRELDWTYEPQEFEDNSGHRLSQSNTIGVFTIFFLLFVYNY